MRPVTQLKCIYTNACGMGSEQDLEAMVQQENYELVAITETRQDHSYDQSAAMESYKTSGGEGKGGEVVGWLSMLQSVSTLQSSILGMMMLSHYR